jgi:hypothetical protein
MCGAVSAAIWYLPHIVMSIKGLLFMAFALYFSVDFLWSVLVQQKPGIKQSSPAEPHMGGRHTYGGVLPGDPKGSFVTLVSPPQCHAALGTIPHALASEDQSPACRHRTLPPSASRKPMVRFWSGYRHVRQKVLQNLPITFASLAVLTSTRKHSETTERIFIQSGIET